MSFPLDLSVTGKPTPRVQRETSRRPLSANRAKNRTSNIFGTEEKPKIRATGNAKEAEARPPVKASFISKSQLEDTKKLLQNSDESIEQARNEIGGEQIIAYRNKKAPDGVPRLQLQELVDSDDKLTDPLLASKHDVSTPNSKASVSWGTPLSANRRPPSGKKARGGGWQVHQTRKSPSSAKLSGRKKHDDVPTLDLQLSQSNEGLRELTKTAKQVREDLDIEYIGAAKYMANQAKPKPENRINQKQEVDEEREKTKSDNVQRNVLGEVWPETEADNQTVIPDLKQLSVTKKAQFVEEALLADQISRTTMDDPEPEKDKLYNGSVDPKMRRHMDLFHTRPQSAPVGPLLVKRLRFGARILSRNGHDALREISGFFFPNDSSLTMYQFRQFGTRSSALPFIQRGCYSHLRGPKEGETYDLPDITVGNTLHFATEKHTSLPTNLLSKPVISFRITDVDQATKETLLYAGCTNAYEKEAKERWVDGFSSEEERSSKAYLEQIQELVHKQLEQRATKTITHLARHFRKFEKTGKRVIELEDFKAALKKFRLILPPEDTAVVWELVHDEAVGTVEYVDLVRALIGEMNEVRKSLVRKAFMRFDPSKVGSVKAAVVRKFFNARQHPDVSKGAATEFSIISDFLSNFEEAEKNGDISFKEFEEYYEGESLRYTSDQDFALMMRNTWGVNSV